MLRENKNLTFAGHYISQDGKETRKSYLGWHNPTTYRIVQELKVAYRVDSCHSHQQQEQKHQLCLCHIEIHVWKTNYFSIQSLYVYLWSIILLLLKKNVFSICILSCVLLFVFRKAAYCFFISDTSCPGGLAVLQVQQNSREVSTWRDWIVNYFLTRKTFTNETGSI